ncbi:hypothetical protein AUP74_03321 [Microbulbifer aggregans]|uniref:Archease domain-containing protein n=1 Tax=Microbulbifer aggregans TaxID=1769779 RepID=A0A1C9WC41_9GAMM|nr:hypothetical protein AUP74_03321 [Microbulbifer aggregans]
MGVLGYAYRNCIEEPALSPHWEHFSHDADMGVRGIGNSLAQAFEQAALAMTAIIVDPPAVRPAERVPIHCECPDQELLLVDWLNALVYEMACRNMLFSRFQLKIEDDRLTGTALGEPVDRERHRPTVEVKGATYTALRVKQRKDGSWLAQCVVDV